MSYLRGCKEVESNRDRNAQQMEQTTHVNVDLTNCPEQLAEDFVIKFYVGPAVLKVIDPDQFRGIPKKPCLHETGTKSNRGDFIPPSRPSRLCSDRDEIRAG